MINFHKDILLKIWEYDDTIKNNFQKCINEIKRLSADKNNLIICITDYIEYENKENINYIIKNKKKIINQKICNSHYKYRMINSDIIEYEIYYKNNEIKLVVYSIKYNNLLQKL